MPAQVAFCDRRASDLDGGSITATSAVTVTGLVVVDTGSQYTLFGQLVILTLIQLGGLGLMTFAVLTALALGFKLRLEHQLVAQEAFNEISLQTARRASGSIAVFALTAEGIGVVLLGVFFVPELGGPRVFTRPCSTQYQRLTMPALLCRQIAFLPTLTILASACP